MLIILKMMERSIIIVLLLTGMSIMLLLFLIVIIMITNSDCDNNVSGDQMMVEILKMTIYVISITLVLRVIMITKIYNSAVQIKIMIV